MSKKKLAVAIAFFCVLNVFAACEEPTPGTPVWQLAADALGTICTIESKVCQLLADVNGDFAGTFTVAEQILDKVCTGESFAQLIDSSFDELIINLPMSISKACVIESKLDVLIPQIEAIDLSGTFTALDELKTIICSKLEQVSVDLQQVEINITILTSSEIDHAVTIASQLSVLQTDVDLLNSALDGLNLITGIDGIDSCVDILSSLVDDLELDVCNLQNSIFYGFAGTFTALDAQLSLACTVESLVEHAQAIAMVDFSGVFTALNALQETVCDIESLVDIVSLINARNIICTVDSKIDIALSKICLAEQEILPLPSLADEIISKLDAVDLSNLDAICSDIAADISLLDIIESKVDTIESKVNQIDILDNTSKLEFIASELATIDSTLDTIDVTASKLCVIDSKVDLLNQEALTIESIIDVIDTQAKLVNSKIDALHLQSTADLIESKLCEIEPATRLICSNLDLLLASLNATDSKADIIIEVSQSSIEQLLTVESRIDVIDSTLDTISATSLISKLCIIQDQVCTIESTLDIIGPLIGMLNMKAQGLIVDFQETWTILNAIEQKECTDVSLLVIISSKLDLDINADLSGVYTVIDSIILKESTVDSKVDSALSLVDVFISKQDVALDFSGVFTALNAILLKVCTVESQTDVLDSKVDVLVTYCGIPIYQSDVGTSGYTISTSERYFLAEDILFTPTVGLVPAITIAVSDVTLDLSEREIAQGTNASANDGILVNNGLSNIRIENGTIRNNQGRGIRVADGAMQSTNLLFSNLVVKDIGPGPSSGIECFSTNNAIIRNVAALNAGMDGMRIANSHDVVVASCLLQDNTQEGLTFSNSFRCYFLHNVSYRNSRRGFDTVSGSELNTYINSKAIDNGSDGLHLNAEDKGTVKGCLSINNSGHGLTIGGNSCINWVITDNTFMHNSSSGIRVDSSTSDNYFAFNTCIENGTNFDEPASGGPATYLGNFAFNSTAVGNPNNTNYNILGGSVITGKFVTGSERGSFGDFPTKWHNINMLP